MFCSCCRVLEEALAVEQKGQGQVGQNIIQAQRYWLEQEEEERKSREIFRSVLNGKMDSSPKHQQSPWLMNQATVHSSLPTDV